MTAVPYWASDDGDVTLHLGDCLDVLRTLPADSVDAIVTDPPAGIAFMSPDVGHVRAPGPVRGVAHRAAVCVAAGAEAGGARSGVVVAADGALDGVGGGECRIRGPGLRAARVRVGVPEVAERVRRH